MHTQFLVYTLLRVYAYKYSILNQIAEAQKAHPRAFILAILCDLSKAFDVIDIKFLIRKLDYYGIRGIIKDWLISYLTNRTQYVEFENKKSLMCDLNCGVPQGSILGPLLYLIYVNDIPTASNSMILSFADDTLIVKNSLLPGKWSICKGKSRNG